MPETDFEILHKIICTNAIVTMTDVYDKKCAKLVESQQTDSFVFIKNFPEDSIIINIDKFPSPDHILNSDKGACKRADYAIISVQGTKKRIILIEMKSSKHERHKIISQLKGAVCVMTYICKIAEEFYEIPNFLSEYEYRFVSLKHTTLAKRPTREKTTQRVHNNPDNMLTFSGKQIIFYQQLQA